MNSKKVYFLMLGALGILFLAGLTAVAYGKSLLDKQGKKLVELKIENRQLEAQESAIKKANQEIEKYADLEEIAKSIVPQDKDQAKAIREIVAIGNKTKITIQSISFTSSTLGAKTSPSAAQSAPLNVTQAKPVTGLPGVYAISMTVEPSGSYYDFLNFLEGLENNRRTAQVNGVSIKPRSSASGTISGYDFSLDLSIFIKPGAAQ